METINTNLITNSDAVVSCSGSSCNFCSFLETLSGIYNFFLLTIFVVAILILILSGINYILNKGVTESQKKNQQRIKSTLLGFVLVLLGWLIINTTYRVLGYQNAGNWYQFKCNLEAPQVPKIETNFSAYYQNLKVYKELADFLTSGDQKATIKGPTLSPVLQKQLQDLTEGEILHILAPARVSSSTTPGEYTDLFLPLLTVSKDGNQVKLDSLGDYTNLIQNEYSQSDKTNTTLNTLLETTSGNKDTIPITASGNQLQSSDFNNIYGQIAEIIKNQQPGTDKSLSGQLAVTANNKSNEDVQRIIAILVSETMKTTDLLMLEKEDSVNVLSDSQVRCQLSGGQWIDNNCKCPNDTTLVKDVCKKKNDLKAKCERSQGVWTLIKNGYSPTISCGYIENQLGTNPNIGDSYQRANISDVNTDESYCKCPTGTCIDSDGTCQKQEEDSDNDKIPNAKDKCPNTSKEDISQINTTEGSQYYGCSCNDIGVQTKVCPPDQCLGDYKVTYPKGLKTCNKGITETYSCSPSGQTYDPLCANQNMLANSNNNQNKKANSNGKGSDNKNINDDFFGKNSKGKDIGENKLGPPGGNAMYSKPEGVKAALKRIHDTDPLRYEMIFRYVSTIAPTSFSGGLCYGCGYEEVNYGLPVKMLDQVIVHESTHSGHFCWGMSETTAEVERIAVGNEIGSLERSKKDDKGRNVNDMQEFTRQSKEITYESSPARGYLSRFMPEDNPKGDLIAEDYHWAISYALSYGDNTKGPNHHGWPQKGYLLGLKDSEQQIVDKIIKNMESFPCRSKPPSDLPEIPACKDAPEIKLGGK